MMFVIDRRLAACTAPVGDLPLSQALLMNDSRYPWLVLVPRREAAREIADLATQDRAQLVEEIARVSDVMKRLSGSDKINVAAIGNVVPQLHVHVVARFDHDATWPGTVWNRGMAIPYPSDDLRQLTRELAEALEISWAEPG